MHHMVVWCLVLLFSSEKNAPSLPRTVISHESALNHALPLLEKAVSNNLKPRLVDVKWQLQLAALLVAFCVS